MSEISPDRNAPRPVSIRVGTPADAEAICTLHRRSILMLGREFYTQAEVESWAHGLVPERYAKAMAEHGETFLVAADGSGDGAGAMLGFCSYRDDEIRGLYADPEFARRGVGGALLRRAEAQMAAAGHRRLWLQASLAGQPFYEAQGYEAGDEYPWKSRGGLEIMVKRMEKLLA